MQLYRQDNVSPDAKRALIVLSSGGRSPDHPVIDAALQASMSHATGLLVPLAHHFQEEIPPYALARLEAGILLESEVVRSVRTIAKDRPLIVGGKSLGGVIAAGSLAGLGSELSGNTTTLLMLGVPLDLFFRPHLERYLTELAKRNCRVVAFQGTKDKYSNPEGVKAFFEQVGLNPDNVIELPGDHDLGFGEGISDADLQQAGMRLAEVMQKHVFCAH